MKSQLIVTQLLSVSEVKQKLATMKTASHPLTKRLGKQVTEIL